MNAAPLLGPAGNTASVTVAAERGEIILESLPEAVIACDLGGNTLYLNPLAARLLSQGEIPPLEQTLRHLVGTRRLIPDASTGELVQACIACMSITDNSMATTFRWDEKSCVVEVSAGLVKDGSRVTGLVLTVRLAARSSELLRHLLYWATHDELTMLVNRRELRLRLDRLVATWDACSEHAVLMLDLDNFKAVNDSCGHAAGDQALHRVASAIAATVRQRDTLARVGGDEFCLIMEHCSLNQAVETAERLRVAVRDCRFVRNGRRFRLGVSIGVVALSQRHCDVDAVLAEADEACYRAKKAGGNRVEVFQSRDCAQSDV